MFASSRLKSNAFLAVALAAAALALPAAAGVAADPVAQASGCTWEGFKITQRENTTCRKARKALRYYYGGGGSSQGYTCRTTAATNYMGGKCTNGNTKSFKFAPR